MKSHVKAFKIHTKLLKQNHRIQMKNLGDAYKTRMRQAEEEHNQNYHQNLREESLNAERNAAAF
jgi:hypothetical protein